MFVILFITLFALSWAGEEDFIVGGKDVDFAGKYPWQASLTNNNGGHFCGGAIIDEYWIVTAAHCVQRQRENGMKIIVGRHQLYSNYLGKPVTHDVKKIIYHTVYPGGTLFTTNDIALVQVIDPIQFNHNVQKIVMASPGADLLGQTCVLTGWGRYNENSNAPANTLQELDTTVISRSECENGFKRYGWKIADSHICFKKIGATACHGDSGGPAVCKVDGTWNLVGVTSGGSPQCYKGFPNIYTRISSWRSWISKNAKL